MSQNIIGAESWRSIGPFPAYEVSDRGRVRRAAGKTAGRIKAVSVDHWGYVKVHLSGGRRGREKMVFVHVLVAAAFIGPKPEGMQVNHKDGVKTNNVADNLEYVTPLQNMRHARSAGLWAIQGEKHGKAKLTEDQAREVLERLRNGERQADVAARYGVCQTAVSKIKRGENWPHLQQQAGNP